MLRWSRDHSVWSIGLAPVGGLAATPRPASQARADEFADRLHQMRQIGAQPIEARQPVQGALIHIERPIDLDLQTVAVLGRAPLAADNLDALVAFVDPDVVAEPAQEAGDEIGKFRSAGRAIAIA